MAFITAGKSISPKIYQLVHAYRGDLPRKPRLVDRSTRPGQIELKFGIHVEDLMQKSHVNRREYLPDR